MFVGKACGRAEEAVDFYTSVFRNSDKEEMIYYREDEAPDKEGTVRYGRCTIEGQKLVVMDSAHDPNFQFNEAISFAVNCDSQQEVDYYWEKLSADPKSEQCGWLKDKFGLSWQIIPLEMTRMLQEGSKAQIARVTEAFLQMKKLDLAVLEEAFAGNGVNA